MGKKKRKNKRNSKAHAGIGIKEVLTRFNDKDFQGAFTLLKRARVTTQEAGLAKQLKVCLVNRIALEKIKDKSHQSSLELLEPTLNIQEKPGFSLPLDVTNLLVGINLLYIGRFDEAIARLNACRSAKTTGFVFYYLLALIYGSKGAESEFKAFCELHKVDFEACSATEKQYLNVAWYIVRHKFDNAFALLDHEVFSALSKQQNLNFLKGILNRNLTGLISDDQVKIAYKVFVDLNITEIEKAFLLAFDEFEELMFALEGTREKQILQSHLSKLCIEGLPLERDDFLYTLEKSADFQKSFIVYNQIANLYNKDLEKLDKEVYHYLRKYMNLFLQIPESLELYYEIVVRNPDKIRKESFWRNTKTFLTRFGKSLSLLVLNNIGWKIQNISIADNILDHKHPDYLVRICQENPALIGPKIQLFLCLLGIPGNQIPDEVKDVFSLDHIKENKASILRAIKEYLYSFLVDYSEFPNFNVAHRLIKELSIKLSVMQKIILDYIGIHDPSPDAVVLLDIFREIHEISLMVKEESPDLISSNGIIKLNENYQLVVNALKSAGTPDEIFEEYGQLISTDLLRQLRKLLNYRPDKNKVEAELEYIIDRGHGKILNSFFVEMIEEEHFSDTYSLGVISFFTVLSKKSPESAIEEAIKFVKEYLPFTEVYYCNHPDEFYIGIVNGLMKKPQHPVLSEVIVRLIEGYTGILVTTIKPKNYNAAGQFLLFIKKAIEKNPDLYFVKSDVLLLIGFLTNVVKRKRLKTLGRTLDYVKDFFVDRL